jgi:hypothetical protein
MLEVKIEALTAAIETLTRTLGALGRIPPVPAPEPEPERADIIPPPASKRGKPAKKVDEAQGEAQAPAQLDYSADLVPAFLTYIRTHGAEAAKALLSSIQPKAARLQDIEKSLWPDVLAALKRAEQ